MFRPDFPLVRHLAETGGAYAAQAWQSLPYILLPGEGFAAYAMDHVSGSGLPPPDRLPWPDAVYDFPEGTAQILRRLWHTTLGEQDVTPTLPNRGRCWMRVRTTREPGDGYLVETWEEQVSTGGLPPGPDITFVPWERAPYRALHIFPNPRCPRGRYDDRFGWCALEVCNFRHDQARILPCAGSSMIMNAGVLLIQAILIYLSGMDEYLVQVEPVLDARGRRQATKSAAQKPWTRLDLPHYILIDPQRAHEYGRTESPGGEGHHASPRPHTRRGHWRELRAERYEREADGAPRKLWIKPAWVGASEWTSEGARYRVVPPRF
jgi:hypothetical protein